MKPTLFKKIVVTSKMDSQSMAYFIDRSIPCQCNDLRKLYIKPFYYERPSVFKLIQLFTTVNLKEICNLGRFLLRATIKRNLLI